MGNTPAGKTLREPIEIMKFAPSRLHEEISHEQGNKQLRNPFLPVKQTTHFFKVLLYSHCPVISRHHPVLSIEAPIQCFG